MGVRSARIAGPTRALSNVQTTLFTVPAGKTYLVKRLTILTWTSGTWRVLLGIGGLGEAEVILDAAVAHQAPRDAETFWPFEPGDSLRFMCVGAPVTLVAWGAILNGVA